MNLLATNAGDELKTHYSIGWHWYKNDDGVAIEVDFGGMKNVIQHIIDIFDSVDVQVATVKQSTMICRLQKNFVSSDCDGAVEPNLWSYSQYKNKKMFALLYTNKGGSSSCSTHFFPKPDCTAAWTLYHTELAMWNQVKSQHL